jgi:hypothetical protein
MSYQIKSDGMDYESIKSLAKQLRRPVSELIALSPQNDPFYVGTERDKSLGGWFRDLWRKFGYSTGVHIRRMHYAIVSQNPPISFPPSDKYPNGKPYQNTLECWGELTNAAKAARYLKYVDPAAFVDRRNEDPKSYDEWWVEKQADSDITDVLDETSDIAMPTLYDAPYYELKEFTSPQRYHLEIWCEKSTMNDILIPLVQKYKAVVLYGKGELSITAAREAIARFYRADKPVRIFYVSDFDPAGACMPVSMSRKLEYFVHQLELNLDIKLYPIVLTHEQTKQYPKLLPTPIKESEKRKASFEAKYGEGAIELDALEALYPGELRKILVRELDRYYDDTLEDRLKDFHQEQETKLSEVQESVYAEHADAMQSIEDEATELESEWQAIIEPFTEEMNAHIERRVEVWQAIKDSLEENQPEIPEDDIPEAVEAEERSGALYDSTRDYLTQNDVYQAHKQGLSLDLVD